VLSIVRGGPRLLLLSGNEDAMKSLVSSRFTCTEHTLEGAFDSAGEGQSVLLFRGDQWRDERRFLMAAAAADEILALFLNSGAEAMPASVRIMPRLLFFPGLWGKGTGHRPDCPGLLRRAGKTPVRPSGFEE